YFFFFQAEDGIRYFHVTGVQTCALPISRRPGAPPPAGPPAATGPPPAGSPPGWRPRRPRAGPRWPPRWWPAPPPAYPSPSPPARSEERRVGKEGKTRGSP